MFQRKYKKTPNNLTFYPAGTFLHTEQGYFYVVKPDKRFRFITERCMQSWNPIKIIEASEQDAAVKRLRIASKMKFRDGSLLYSHASGKMYLVSNHLLRHITNPDWLPHLGFDRNEATWVSEAEINLHELGAPLG